MMFRRLYWVTEDVQADGKSQVRGVYTSIPDLIGCDLNGRSNGDKMRLSLVKLDCKGKPLGTWDSSEFGKLENDLQEFVRTEEFSSEHCAQLLDAVGKISAAKV